MSDIFFLDQDYSTYKTGKKLKFETVYPHPIIYPPKVGFGISDWLFILMFGCMSCSTIGTCILSIGEALRLNLQGVKANAYISFSVLTFVVGIFPSYVVWVWAKANIKRIVQSRMIPRARQKALKLKRRGQFIEGEILDSWLKERENKLSLTIRYRFDSPNGRQLKGKQTKQRDDLIYFEPPPAGTPVRVLYADDKTHIIL